MALAFAFGPDPGLRSQVFGRQSLLNRGAERVICKALYIKGYISGSNISNKVSPYYSYYLEPSIGLAARSQPYGV